jgi:colanic acid/amylovoran biosynthesis protein
LGDLRFLAGLLPRLLLWLATGPRPERDFLLGRRLAGLVAEYRRADLVVAAGGGYLYSRSALRGNLTLLLHLGCFYLGVLAGKPVYLYAQSIGPFAARFQERLVARALGRVRLVGAREAITRQRLEDWGLRRPVHETADAAFILGGSSREGAGATPADAAHPLVGPAAARGDVGLTVRRWLRGGRRQRRFEETVAGFSAWLSAEKGYRAVFFPQVTHAAAGDDDRAAARAVASLAGPRAAVLLVEEELGPRELMRLCGRMRFFVGTRLHSVLFALAAGVPSLAIGYQPKTAGIMCQLGLEEFVLPMEEPDLERLKGAFETLERREEKLRALLAGLLPRMRERALENGRLIEEDYRLFAAEQGRR